jgi:hypothetical protein
VFVAGIERAIADGQHARSIGRDLDTDTDDRACDIGTGHAHPDPHGAADECHDQRAVRRRGLDVSGRYSSLPLPRSREHLV